MSLIEVRYGEEPADDDVFVIHMGAGAADPVVFGAIRNHDAYIGLIDDAGRFTVSVFAVMSGVTEAMIVNAMPQGQFGRATFGEIRRSGLRYLATSIVERDQSPEWGLLQGVHYDLLLPVDGRASHVVDLTPPELSELRLELVGPVTAVLELFAPRRRK